MNSLHQWNSFTSPSVTWHSGSIVEIAFAFTLNKSLQVSINYIIQVPSLKWHLSFTPWLRNTFEFPSASRHSVSMTKWHIQKPDLFMFPWESVLLLCYPDILSQPGASLTFLGTKCPLNLSSPLFHGFQLSAIKPLNSGTECSFKWDNSVYQTICSVSELL